MFVSSWAGDPSPRGGLKDGGRANAISATCIRPSPNSLMTESILIKPTVGRVVWFYPENDDEHFKDQGKGPFTAMVCKVHGDFMVNLVVFNVYGESEGRLTIPLVQEGQPVPFGAYAEWMPYQIGQAKKHDAAA